MTPEEYLAFLQRAMSSPESEPLSPEEYEERIEARLRHLIHRNDLDLDSIRGKLSANLSRVATGNDAATDAMIRPRLLEIYEVARSAGINAADSEPLFGTLPTFGCNACTLWAPGHDRVIVAFTSGLPHFLNRIAKIALMVHYAVPPSVYDKLNETGEDPREGYRHAVDKVLRENELITRRFATVLAAFAFEAPYLLPVQQPPTVVTPGPVDLVGLTRTALLSGAERFVAGHEFGHVAQGVEGSAVSVASTQIRGVEVTTLSRNHELEIEADVTGYFLSHTYAHRRHYPQGREGGGLGVMVDYLYDFDLAGANFFLMAAAALDEAHERHTGMRPAYDTHPPYAYRLEQLKGMYESLYGFENVNAMTLEVIIDVLKRASAALPGGMVEAIAFASEEKRQGVTWDTPMSFGLE
ncbi:hypothetical protein OG381_36795 [Streptomyces sp. NBC_00490]|uniref:hypothetical protein n=1 Tax=Streptomyces sp. NBC_00490 TaxID=2903657 RepID=UPI002E170FF3